MVEPQANNTRSKWALAALAALFLVGIGGPVVMYVTGWYPTSTRNYGELVEPARPLTEVALQTASGETVSTGQLRGRWTLVYFGPAECLSACRENLHKMRQIVLAQGREAHRVRRLFVVTDPLGRDGLRYLLADYPGTEVWSGAGVPRLAEQFGLPLGSPMDNLHRVYVVDPLGNFMMSYPADAELRRMNKDIRVLLRTSQVG